MPSSRARDNSYMGGSKRKRNKSCVLAPPAHAQTVTQETNKQTPDARTRWCHGVLVCTHLSSEKASRVCFFRMAPIFTKKSFFQSAIRVDMVPRKATSCDSSQQQQQQQVCTHTQRERERERHTHEHEHTCDQGCLPSFRRNITIPSRNSSSELPFFCCYFFSAWC